MTDYNVLAANLKICGGGGDGCNGCSYYENGIECDSGDALIREAADAFHAEQARKVTEDMIDALRANADWLTDDMPVPGDLKENILKAARLLEIEQTRRDFHQLGEEIKDKQICEVLI